MFFNSFLATSLWMCFENCSSLYVPQFWWPLICPLIYCPWQIMESGAGKGMVKFSDTQMESKIRISKLRRFGCWRNLKGGIFVCWWHSMRSFWLMAKLKCKAFSNMSVQKFKLKASIIFLSKQYSFNWQLYPDLFHILNIKSNAPL